MSKAIIIGGAGFIGSNLVQYILDNNIYSEIVVVDNFSTGKPSNRKDSVKYYSCNFGEVNLYQDELENASAVFHLAAKARVQPSITDPVSFDYVNVHSTVKLLKACVDKNVKSFVFSSSSSIYGDTSEFPTPETAPSIPMSPYGLQKLIGEQYCKLFSEVIKCPNGDFMNTACLRYFNVYGENMLNEGSYCLVMGVFDSQKAKGEPLTICGDGEQRRDFTYVKDVVKANVAAAKYMESNVCKGEIFNIGNGDNRSINDIAKLYNHEIKYLPARLEPNKTLADNSKARKVLNWSPEGNIENWITNHLKKYE